MKGRTPYLIYISHKLSEADLFWHTREGGKNKGNKASRGNRDREKGEGTARLGSINQWKWYGRMGGPWGPTATIITTAPPVTKPASLRMHRRGGAAARQRERVRAAPASNLGSLPPPVMTTVKAIRATATATVMMAVAILWVTWARSPPMWSVALVPPLSRYLYLLSPRPGWKRIPQDPQRRPG